MGSCRLFLGPGFRLAARWNRLVETVKTRKKREKTGRKWARYSLKGVKDGSQPRINWQAAATSRELDASASENARLVVEQEGMAAELARLQGSWQARLSVCSFLGTAASDTEQSVVPTLSKVWPSVPSRLTPDPVRWG